MISPHYSRRYFQLLACATFLFVLLSWTTTAKATDSVAAHRDCPTSVCPTDPVRASFTIATAQVIRWEATYRGEARDGHSFYLSTRNASSAEPGVDIALTTRGEAGGERLLSRGTYHISILAGAMGPGDYTVYFNRTAAIDVAPAGTHDFGPVVAGTGPSAYPTFVYTVSYMGDTGLSVAVSITLSDSDRFTVSPATGTVSATSPLRFTVTFAPLSSATASVSHPGTITITGRCTPDPSVPPISVAPVSRTVRGTSLPNVPDIDCPGGSCGTESVLGSARNLGRVDGLTGVPQTFNIPIQNVGGGVLNITSITIVNDVGNAFSYTGPASTTIGAGRTAPNITVSFAPLPLPTDRNYCAHLVIETDNDPDERMKSCFFQAVGHHPAPQMRVVTSPLLGGTDARLLDYLDVEVGFTFHKAIAVYNDGDANLTATVADNCSAPGSCTAGGTSLWIVRQTGIRIIPPGGHELFSMDYRPTVASTTRDQFNMRVTGDDPDPGDQTVDVILRGRGIAPIPIDSVLVMDRSGSMRQVVGPRRKIEALQTAASLFVELLRSTDAGDRIGLVRYDDENDVYLPLDFLTAATPLGTQRDTALDDLSAGAIIDGRLEPRMPPHGSTGIGGGMRLGAAMFPVGSSPPPSERKQAMVVLTDGIENVDPHVRDVLPEIISDHPNLKIYSIGLGREHPPGGAPPEIETTILQTITNVFNGYHQVSDDLSDVSRFELEAFYFKIFSNVAGISITRDPTVVVRVNGAAPIIVDRAHIVSSDHNAIFMVVDDPDMREFYTLEIVTPSGEVLTPATTAGGIAVQHRHNNNYNIYKVVFPDESLASGYVGEWLLRLTPNGTWSDTSVKAALRCPPPLTRGRAPVIPFAFSFAQTNERSDTPCERFRRRPDAINPFEALAPVAFGAAVGSDYRMDVRVQPSHFLPTADVKLTATLTDRRAPALDGEVFVDVTTPGHTHIDGLPMFDDGTHGDDVARDGTWTTHFIQTIEGGSYKFFFRGIGRNERGELAPREETRYLTLFLPLQTGGGSQGAGDKGRSPWFSFHLGHSFPVGSFRKEFDSGPSLTVDVEFPVIRNFSIYSMFGYHRFHAQPAGSPNLSVKNLNLNLRAYFPVGSWQGFVQAGPGAYFQRPGSNSFGYNVGAGLNFPVLPKLAFELGVDFHHLDFGGTNRKFIDSKLGIKFRF